jgi:hypothetical protein
VDIFMPSMRWDGVNAQPGAILEIILANLMMI